MGSPKPVLKGSTKASYLCDECKLTFTGTECTHCGNAKNNHKLDQNGIELNVQNPKVFFSPEMGTNPDNPIDDEYLFSLQASRMATETFKENLRDAYVMKSELSRLEIEKKLLMKKRELEQFRDGVVDTYPPAGHQSPEAQQISQMPLFGSQSPQAQFMSQLMRMNGENRAEFISQLSDADPQALSTLSGMFVQPMQNPGGYPGAGGMYPPPWMTQQQPQKDSTESAVSMMKEMFGLMQAMQPKQDNSSNELARELKDELKSLHGRIDSVVEKRHGSNDNMEPILNYMKHLEKKIDESQYRPNFSEQARELKATIKDLESIGLVNNNTSDATFEDKIKMKQLEHQIEMENRKFTLETDMAEISRSSQNTKEAMVKQLFTHGLSHRSEPAEVPAQKAPYQPPALPYSSKMISRPRDIVQEFESDSGTVCEVKHNRYDDGE